MRRIARVDGYVRVAAASAGTIVAVVLLLALATSGTAQQAGDPCTTDYGSGHWVDGGYEMVCQVDKPYDCAAEMQPGEMLSLRRTMVLEFTVNGRRCVVRERSTLIIGGKSYTLPEEIAMGTARGGEVKQTLPADLYQRAQRALEQGERVTFVARFTSDAPRTGTEVRRFQFQLTPLPPPVLGRRVNVEVVRGTVRVRSPGGRFKELRLGQQIPVGWFVDTTRGTVRLTSAANNLGATQTAKFFDAIFQIRQKRRSGAFTELKLAGPLVGCARASASDVDAVASRRRRGRRLWGNGTGRFRSIGTRASAGIRGTKWAVEDRCDRTTWVYVKRGRVEVRDFVKRKTVVLRAGQRYVARPRR